MTIGSVRHVAVLPARAGSIGIPGKNALLFDLAADFIESLGWFETVYVSSNDPAVVALGASRGYSLRERPAAIAGPLEPIRSTMADLVSHFGIDGGVYLWLFYIPFVFRDARDFQRMRRLVEEALPTSLSSFVPAKTHPYRCWWQDAKTGKMHPFVADAAPSRQAFPDAWANHHYLYCIRADALDSVNSNLLGPDTYPVFLTEAEADRLIELDEMSDLDDWQRRYPEQYERWWRALPTSCRIGPEPRA